MITPENAQQLSAQFVFKQGWISDLAWSSDGNIFALATARGPVLYNLAFPNQPRLLEGGHAEPVRAVAIQNNWLYSGSDDGTLWRWNIQTGDGEPAFSDHTSQINTIAIHPTADLIASGGKDSSVYLWNSDGVQGNLSGHEEEVTFASFSPDGDRLATASWDGTVRIWDVETHENVKVLRGHAARVNEINFSPDGSQLVSTGRDGAVHIWVTASWKLTTSLEGHTDAVDRAVFSPDGRLIATGARDNLVRIFNAKTGELAAVLSGHQKPVMALAFNPAGTLLASCGGEHIGVLWGEKET
jgi:WD40 repeat protein